MGGREGGWEGGKEAGGGRWKDRYMTYCQVSSVAGTTGVGAERKQIHTSADDTRTERTILLSLNSFHNCTISIELNWSFAIHVEITQLWMSVLKTKAP